MPYAPAHLQRIRGAVWRQPGRWPGDAVCDGHRSQQAVAGHVGKEPAGASWFPIAYVLQWEGRRRAKSNSQPTGAECRWWRDVWACMIMTTSGAADPAAGHPGCVAVECVLCNRMLQTQYMIPTSQFVYWALAAHPWWRQSCHNSTLAGNAHLACAAADVDAAVGSPVSLHSTRGPPNW
jgi:hypothetical protein